MEPKLFAQTIVSIERKHGLRLDAQEAWLRLDEFKKVKELAGGKCNESKGWYGLKGACKRGKKGESEAKNKESKLTIASKIRDRKGMKDRLTQVKLGGNVDKESNPNQKKQPAMSNAISKEIDYTVKLAKILDTDSIAPTGDKFSESRVKSIMDSGLQSEVPIVLVLSKKGSLEISAEALSSGGEVASYKEAARRSPEVKDRMYVVEVGSKEEGLEAANQQAMIAKKSKGRLPIKEHKMADIEDFKINKSNFSKQDVEKLAQSIARNGNIYQGPQVKRTGLDQLSTQSAADDFAVLGYRRAMEINPELKGRLMAQYV